RRFGRTDGGSHVLAPMLLMVAIGGMVASSGTALNSTQGCYRDRTDWLGPSTNRLSDWDHRRSRPLRFCCIFGAAGPVGYKRWHETTSTRGTGTVRPAFQRPPVRRRGDSVGCPM